MSRLPIVNFKTLEKLLLKLDFEQVRQKGKVVMFFTDILMGERLQFPITLVETLLVH